MQCVTLVRSETSYLDEIRHRYTQHVAGFSAALGSDAKQKVISAAHRGAIPICSDSTVKSFFEQVSSEARLLRWLACSATPSLYDRFCVIAMCIHGLRTIIF